MRLEYEAADDAEPTKVIFNIRMTGREHRVVCLAVAPPAPRESVFVRDVEYDVKSMNWTCYPDCPEMDWVEVILV